MSNPEIIKVVPIEDKKEPSEDTELRRVRDILFGKQKESLEQGIQTLRGELLSRLGNLEKLVSEIQNDKLDREALAGMLSNVVSLLGKEPKTGEPREHAKRSMG